MTGLALETSAYETLIPTKDRQEGLKAFEEKKTPLYRGINREGWFVKESVVGQLRKNKETVQKGVLPNIMKS